MFELKDSPDLCVLFVIMLIALIVVIFRLIDSIVQWVIQRGLNIKSDSVRRHLCFELALRMHNEDCSKSINSSDLSCVLKFSNQLEKESDNYFALIDWEGFAQDLRQCDLIQDDCLILMDNFDVVVNKLVDYVREIPSSDSKRS